MAGRPSLADAHAAPTRRTLTILALAGCAAAATATTLALTSDHATDPAVRAALLDWLILSYVFSGLVAWWRRPASRFGPLMVAAGFLIGLTSIRSANADLLYTLGWALDLVPAAVFLHVYLAFPSGSLQGRLERSLVATAYAIASLQVVGLLLGGFGPKNVLAVADDPGAAQTLLRIQLVALSVLLLAGVAILVGRRRRPGRPHRRSIALLVDAFSFALVMIAVLFLTGVFNQASAVVPIQRATFIVLGFAPIAFVVGLLHARLARSAVAQLVVELRADPAPAELRDALRRALRDRSLSLVYWLPEFGSWADLDGRPAVLEDDGDGVSTTLIESNGTNVAALRHSASLDDEPELLEAVVAAAAISLENSRLNVELKAHLEELKRSRRRVIEAGDAERRRLERNLHDGAQQRMVAIALQLALVNGRIRQDPGGAEEMVRTATDELRLSLGELRDLARGLHPAVLEHGLDAALRALAARSPVPTSVSFDVPGDGLPEDVELAAYFVACEAMANVAKYAQATTAAIRVARDGHALAVEIADDGVGGADAGSGSGLRGLADRVEALDGSLLVSSAAGGGTVVTARMPCAI